MGIGKDIVVNMWILRCSLSKKLRWNNLLLIKANLIDFLGIFHTTRGFSMVIHTEFALKPPTKDKKPLEKPKSTNFYFSFATSINFSTQKNRFQSKRNFKTTVSVKSFQKCRISISQKKRRKKETYWKYHLIQYYLKSARDVCSNIG